MDSVKALTAGLIDYAGLFPPATLGMREAVQNYREYLTGPDSAYLGAFVLPVQRLEEFDDAVAPILAGSHSWRISLLVKDGGELLAPDGNLLPRSAHAKVRITSVEMALSAMGALPATPAKGAKQFETYIEVPVADDVATVMPKLAARGFRAKMRTGGITETAFPSTFHIIRFMRACSNSGISFKATAGLHHPLRAEFPLTYEKNSARAKMYGFLNVFLAAAFMWNGADDATAAKILEESDPSAIAFSSGGASWRGSDLSTNRIAAARESFAHSFGSCSFREPVDELKLLFTPATV
ncbi:MAG: hypothetical protein H0W63_07905 [Gemmatimonadaceae bacterium]|nr:hypothetical protein [Gemmatimonadaceae bacterium]